jgi:hypothetical protein
MNKHNRIVRILIASLIAAGFVLASGQPASAGPGSPGPKLSTKTTLSSTR